MERKVYVLMWHRDPKTQPANMRAGQFFATTTRKRIALREARKLRATVYAIPYPGAGWDCPTIRATFDPIFRGDK